jgi:hypothetical protein
MRSIGVAMLIIPVVLRCLEQRRLSKRTVQLSP